MYPVGRCAAPSLNRAHISITRSHLKEKIIIKREKPILIDNPIAYVPLRRRRLYNNIIDGRAHTHTHTHRHYGGVLRNTASRRFLSINARARARRVITCRRRYIINSNFTRARARTLSPSRRKVTKPVPAPSRPSRYKSVLYPQVSISIRLGM